jgi:hypothetical protein
MSGLEAEAARELRNQQDFVEYGHYVLKGIVLIFIINNQIIWSSCVLISHLPWAGGGYSKRIE